MDEQKGSGGGNSLLTPTVKERRGTDANPRLVGVIYIRSQGKYGWISRERAATYYYVDRSDLGAALPGDQVYFRVVKTKHRSGLPGTTSLKPQAEVVGICKRKPRNIVVLINNQQVRVFNLDLQYYRVQIVNPHVVQNNFYYACELDRVQNQCIFVRLTNKISASNDDNAQIKALINEFGILTTFNPQVQVELDRIPTIVSAATVTNYQQRVDLTAATLVTIDGSTAQDFDDAVGVTIMPNGHFKLLVAIADVTHYVPAGSALDRAAMMRGCSVYLPQQTFPMLPAKLSNDLCSLHPAVQRLSVVCEIELDATAHVLHSKFYRAIINSRARLTYQQVDDFFNAKQSLASGAVEIMLKQAQQLAVLLATKYQAAGYISLNLIQQKLELNAAHQVTKISVHEQTSPSRKLIELFMITANQQAAIFLQRKFKRNLVFRNHLPIQETKLAQVIKQSKQLLPNLQLTPKSHNRYQHRIVQTIIDQLGAQPQTRRLIDYVVVRNLERAFYHEKNQKHFGLGMNIYTHFTSPIRRYPDLLVHRLMGLDFDGQKHHATDDQLHHQVVQMCNDGEAKQTKCESAVRKISVIKFMRRYRNQTFAAVIKHVYRWGMKVELENLVQGEVELSEMKDDYYQFEPARIALVGRRTHKTYQIGGMIRVKLIGANAWTRKITFQLVSA